MTQPARAIYRIHRRRGRPSGHDLVALDTFGQSPFAARNQGDRFLPPRGSLLADLVPSIPSLPPMTNFPLRTKLWQLCFVGGRAISRTGSCDQIAHPSAFRSRSRSARVDTPTLSGGLEATRLNRNPQSPRRSQQSRPFNSTMATDSALAANRQRQDGRSGGQPSYQCFENEQNHCRKQEVAAKRLGL